MAPRPSRARRLRIATFNVNGIRSRLAPLLAWLEREQPDVACLQELKADDAAFPIDAIHAAGYGAVWQGQRSWNGVAILARGSDPIESRRGLPVARKDDGSRYLEAVVSGVVVGCIYLPNGNPRPGPKFDFKLDWFGRLIRHAQALWDSGAPVVLAGDFNVVPTDEDIYNPKSWRRDALLQPETRECWQRLLDQGWTDALLARHPERGVYTFWDYFRQHWQRNAGLRIDHLLVGKSLAPRLRDAGVDRWVRGEPKASDHAPAWVELDMAGTRRAARQGPAAKATAAAGTGKAAGATRKPADRAPSATPARTSTAAKPVTPATARKRPTRPSAAPPGTSSSGR